MGTCCGCIERRTGVMALSVILILISISGASVFGALDQGAKTIVPRIFKDLVSIAVNVLLFVGALKDIKWMVLIWLIWTVIGMIITAVLFVIAIVLLGMMGHTGIAIFAAVWMAVDLALNVYFWIVVRQFYSKDMAAIPLTNRGTV